MSNPYPRPLKVFICHSKVDAPAAQELFFFLNDREASPWLDSKSLIGGQYWRQEITQEINLSDAIVICLSKNSLNKEGFIQTEIKYALEKAKEVPKGNIFIIPVKLEECEVPAELQEYHWVNLFEPDGYERLLRSLQTRAKQLAGITVPRSDPMPKLEAKREASNSKVEEKPGRKPVSAAENQPKPVTPPKKVEQKKPPVVTTTPRKRSWWVIAIPVLVLLVLAAVYYFPTATPATNETATEAGITTGGTQLSPTRDSDDGMDLIHIPAGNFTMGSDDGSDASPAHVVFISSFRMDEHEVTNAQYLRCVNAGRCQPPSSAQSSTRSAYYNNSTYANYPVINVSWNDAQAYCTWAGRRLPTEAEWEKAARGVNALPFPWGSDTPTDAFLNYNRRSGDTVRVSTKLSGISPYGLYDMAGNVAEWVNDWYLESYYGGSPASDPAGPASGGLRVLRGGSWASSLNDVHAYARLAFSPENRNNTIGFRCAAGE
jgi:formylglycine-generating enzyme required for sulfatase activity